MTCPDCERYKESAKNWRHKAYELSGHPLPWDRGDTWVGLTDEEIRQLEIMEDEEEERKGWCDPKLLIAWTQTLLKEKNGG
jgi:hypothetical protein